MNGTISPELNRSASASANAQSAPTIFIANLDYAMKVNEYVPVLKKQLEKHGIEITGGDCQQDKADSTGRNRFAILTVANEEQVRLAKSKSNEVKVGYRKVWIYNNAELTQSHRDDILRQLREQLAKQQAVKSGAGPKPQPPYQQLQQQHQQQPSQQSQPIGNEMMNATPPEDPTQRRRYSMMRQSSTLGNSSATGPSFSAFQHASVSSGVGAVIPTVEITPEVDDNSAVITSTPPSMFQVNTPRTADTAYCSMMSTSPTSPPTDNKPTPAPSAGVIGHHRYNSHLHQNHQSNTTPVTTQQPSNIGARAIVGRRQICPAVQMDTPEREGPRRLSSERPSGAEGIEPDNDSVITASEDISLIKTHGEMFLDYVLSTPASCFANSKQVATNRFRQLINDVVSTRSFNPISENVSSFLFYVMSIVNDLRRAGCEHVTFFSKPSQQDLPVKLTDWNEFLSVQISGAPLELYLRTHPCVTIMRLKASQSAAGNVPHWQMTLALDCDKWAYASNFWLESSWPSDFITVFQMFVAEVDDQSSMPSSNSGSVCLERAHFDGITDDLEELERLGWLHLLGSEYDDGSPRLVGLTLPGYAALWRHAVDRRIHKAANRCNGSTPSSDIDGRQWLCVSDLLNMAEEDDLAGRRPFGLFAFVDGFTFQPQWVLAEQFSFRVAPPAAALGMPNVSITCNSQRCAKRRRLTAITDLLTQVPPGTSVDDAVPFDLECFTSDAFITSKRFSVSVNREDVIRKLPFSFQVSHASNSLAHVARPDNQDKSGAHLRRLSWLAMCLHAAGTLFFSLEELSLLYSRLFPSPGAGPLLLESLIELSQGPLPILSCDSTSAVGLTPLGLAASSIRQALMLSAGGSRSIGFTSPISRLVEEWGSSVEDVLEVLTTNDPNVGPHWLQMLSFTQTMDPLDPVATTHHHHSPNYQKAVKLRSLFRQSVSPDVMGFITGGRSSSSMLNIALMSDQSENQQQNDGDADDDCAGLGDRREVHNNIRRSSAPLITRLPSTISIAGALITTPPKSPPKSSLLHRLGGSLLLDDDVFDDATIAMSMSNNSSNDCGTSPYESQETAEEQRVF